MYKKRFCKVLEQIRASYTQPRMRIHIFALLSVSCIQKKNTQMILFKKLYRIIFRTLQKVLRIMFMEKRLESYRE